MFIVKQLHLIFLTLIFISNQTWADTPPLQLATKLDNDFNVTDYWISEKLDGVRGYWNGKTLVTRQGNKILTPSWFTQHWPNIALDGELWTHRGDFENIISCIKRKGPNNTCWKNIKLMVFDLPNYQGRFDQRVAAMKTLLDSPPSPYLGMITQFKLQNKKQLYKSLDDTVLLGGEGLMLHHHNALYQQGRTRNIMKLKKYQDGEATVIKHLPGKGKYHNMLGSIVVKTTDNITFKIGSGFSNEQRKTPPPIGSTITYKYIGKTKRGVPRFASFMRIRPKLN